MRVPIVLVIWVLAFSPIWVLLLLAYRYGGNQAGKASPGPCRGIVSKINRPQLNRSPVVGVFCTGTGMEQDDTTWGAANEGDARLFRQIAEMRDAEAFTALSDIYRAPLHRFLAAQTDNDQAAADDLLQEVWLRLWTRASSFEYDGTVRAWLFRIAANLAANYRRTRTRRRESSLIGEADTENDIARGPEEILFRAEQNASVRRLVAELPEDTRELLRLVHEEEQPLRDVAATSSASRKAR